MGLSYTYTRTSTFDDAPCGCRMRIPNEAYSEVVHLGPCKHGYHHDLRVEEVQERGIWVPRAEWEAVAQTLGGVDG